MFLELHILQNFAPANLNRDDLNSPKSCVFGGYRRARISSQCLKRAIRTTFQDDHLLPVENQAIRTKRLLDELTARLGAQGKDEEEARRVVGAALDGLKLRLDKEGKTQYLIFLGEGEIDRLARVCAEEWEDLLAVTPSEETGKSAREVKKQRKAALPPRVTAALEAVLDGGKAADLALFGRMLADLPERNVDAACQVAHAISTNEVATEFDFYTAVDDIRPEDTAGADMLGTIEFNSACFYRYANVDLGQLLDNLRRDEDLARQTIGAFLRASVLAVPTGKQNSMAAQNPPSLVLAILRSSSRQSLANAFVGPVRPTEDEDLVRRSVRALDRSYGTTTRMYGAQGVEGVWVCSSEDDALDHLESKKRNSVEEVIEDVLAAVRFDGGEVAA